MKYTNDIKEDRGIYLVIDISTPKFPYAEMLIDKMDWIFVRGTKGLGRIYPRSANKYAYPYATAKIKQKPIGIHKIIMGYESEVDHINHNGLDNRSVNLRKCTRTQNAQNTRTPRNNTSGHKGVSWHKEDKRWRAQIGVGGKSVRLGEYRTIEEAIMVREQAVEKHFGEFACEFKHNDYK